jgi:hypothetical protein
MVIQWIARLMGIRVLDTLGQGSVGGVKRGKVSDPLIMAVDCQKRMKYGVLH